MKKLLALLLSLVMLLGLMAGCTRTEDADIDEDETQSDLAETEEQEEEAPETTAPTEKEEEEEPAEPTGYVRGTSNANGWKSEYLGLQFKPTSNMTMATEADMEDMMDITSEVMKDNGFGDMIVNYAMLNTVFEMMATDPSGSSAVVIMEKMTFSGMTEEDYAKSVANQLSASGYSTGSTYEVTLWGKDFVTMDAAAQVNGVSITQSYLLCKVEDRICCIILTDATGKSLETFLGCFSEY